MVSGPLEPLLIWQNVSQDLNNVTIRMTKKFVILKQNYRYSCIDSIGKLMFV